MNDPEKRADFLQDEQFLQNLSPELEEKIQKEMLKPHAALKIFMVILSPEGDEKVSKVFKSERAHMLFKLRAEGTATSELLDLLGLGTSSKIVSICIAPGIVCETLMKKVTKELRLRAPGNGIAFTIPMSGVAAPLARLFNDEIKKHFESEVDKMKTEATYEIVLSVVNPGYSEELMDAARTAGATGGTVVHARQVGNEVAKVWGISLQGEREIIAILVKREQKIEIMKAINAKYGMKSEAQGLIIAMPVDTVAGLDED